jgi:predicted Rossmann fold nucleotide-binding protein DprA/Smf involved in DNA uptake
MITAVVGSRTFTDYDFLESHLDEHPITEIISGGAAGADTLAHEYATANEIPFRAFEPDWRRGKRAGLDRNSDIVGAAEMIIAFWDGESRGTADTIRKARKSGKPTYVIDVSGQ